MANLSDFTSDEEIQGKSSQKNGVGKKRRLWLEDDEIEKQGSELVVAKSRAPYGGKSSFLLRGIQRKVVDYFYRECKEKGSLITGLITKKAISEKIQENIKSISTTITRLVDKGFLTREVFIHGKGGATSYQLKKEVFEEISKNEERFFEGEYLD